MVLRDNLSMWRIMIPMYMLWLHGLCGLHGPQCLLSRKRLLNLITHLSEFTDIIQHIDGFVQDCSNSIANALELLQSCAKPSICVFSCDQAVLWMVQSVRPPVCPSHLFDYVPIIVSSWNFQELLPVTEVTSIQKVKVRGQRSRSQRLQPNLTVSGL